jgi:hypothetical protein
VGYSFFKKISILFTHWASLSATTQQVGKAAPEAGKSMFNRLWRYTPLPSAGSCGVCVAKGSQSRRELRVERLRAELLKSKAVDARPWTPWIWGIPPVADLRPQLSLN